MGVYFAPVQVSISIDSRSWVHWQPVIVQTQEQRACASGAACLPSSITVSMAGKDRQYMHQSAQDHCYDAAGLPSQQAAALYKIKQSLDPRNQLSDWQAGASNACSFSGVTCNDAQEVTEL